MVVERTRERDNADSAESAREIQNEIDILSEWLKEKKSQLTQIGHEHAETNHQKCMEQQDAALATQKRGMESSAQRADRDANPSPAEEVQNHAHSTHSVPVEIDIQKEIASLRSTIMIKMEERKQRAKSHVTKLVKAPSDIQDEVIEVPLVGNKVPPCRLPLWCVVPRLDDIETDVNLVRCTQLAAPKKVILWTTLLGDAGAAVADEDKGSRTRYWTCSDSCFALTCTSSPRLAWPSVSDGPGVRARNFLGQQATT